MFAVIDCGTTTTRIYIVDSERNIVASGRKKIGVRDTSITGNNNKLREGIVELFYEILSDYDLDDESVEFAIASGMITSEVGLMEIPHLIAPAGITELTKGIVKVIDQNVLPIKRPVYFIRGIRNNYPAKAGLDDIQLIDFMRGEEVQCIGIMNGYDLSYPCNIVTLSSHTKIIYVNSNKQIESSFTTLSGQLYEAIVGSTSIGKSLKYDPQEPTGFFEKKDIIKAATSSVKNAGLIRTMMMPRFLQVLLNSSSEERILFADAAIAA